MSLRMTVTVKEDITVIRVDGRLAGDGVPELEHACRSARRPLVLELTHLTAADEAGVVAVRRLAAEGVHLLGASPYITLLMSMSAGGPRPPSLAGRREPRSARPRGTE